MKYIAYTTKGLENTAKKELINKVSDCSIISSAVKNIIFISDASIKLLSEMKTVDDLCIFIEEITDLSKDETAISSLASTLSRINFTEVKKALSSYRKFDSEKFSITASVFGTRYSSTQLTEGLSSTLSQIKKWTYTPREHENFDIIVSVTKVSAIISVRVTEKSLYRRTYKQYFKKGSLRPTIAAAMVLEAVDHKNGLKIVDNFCGSGTILCEALLAGNNVFGGDIDKESVEFTKKNLINIQKGGYEVKKLDAVKTSWNNSYFNCAISNLPWNKQVESNRLTTLYSEAIKEYKRILKPEGVICLLGIKPDFLVSQIKKIFGYKRIRVIRLGYLGQTPSMVIGNPG